MDFAMLVPTPMVDNITNLLREARSSEAGQNYDQKLQSKEQVSSLLYLSTCPGPDITFSVNVLSKFIYALLDMHWSAASEF